MATKICEFDNEEFGNGKRQFGYYWNDKWLAQIRLKESSFSNSPIWESDDSPPVSPREAIELSMLAKPDSFQGEPIDWKFSKLELCYCRKFNEPTSFNWFWLVLFEMQNEESCWHYPIVVLMDSEVLHPKILKLK